MGSETPIKTKDTHMTTINPEIYQTLAIAKGLEFYAKYHRPINTAYTPYNMMYAAEQLTGKKFKPRAYIEAANALRTRVGMEPLP